MFTIEADTDSNTDVVLHAIPGFFVLGIELVCLSHGAVGLALNDQTTTTRRYKLFKHIVELAGNLLEGSFDGFILPLIKYVDEIIDRFLRGIKLFSSVSECLTLLREAVVLFERFLVDMGVLLETLVNFMKLLDDGIGIHVLVLGESFVRKDTKIPDVCCTFGGLLG